MPDDPICHEVPHPTRATSDFHDVCDRANDIGEYVEASQEMVGLRFKEHGAGDA